uniref:Uncharacterized protein n=1 Tax=Glossina austeni TaxID=7395 RepID=A0A1A9UCW5_GLOAU
MVDRPGEDTENKEFIDTQMPMIRQIMQTLANLQQNLIICTDTQTPYPKSLQIGSNMDDNVNLFKDNWIAYTEATGIATWAVKRESKNVNILWSLADGEVNANFSEVHTHLRVAAVRL